MSVISRAVGYGTCACWFASPASRAPAGTRRSLWGHSTGRCHSGLAFEQGTVSSGIFPGPRAGLPYLSYLSYLPWQLTGHAMLGTLQLS